MRALDGALKKPVIEKETPSGKETLTLLASRRPGATIADVVSLDRRLSLTALYVLNKGTVKPLKSLEEGKGKTILARTEGLTPKQKEELTEQNIPIVYVREIPGVPNIHGVETLEKYEGEKDDLYGTTVVPYIKLSEKQAEKVEILASQLPVPKEEKEPQKAKDETKEEYPVTTWWDYPGC